MRTTTLLITSLLFGAIVLAAPPASADQPPPPSPFCQISSEPELGVFPGLCSFHECMRYTYGKIALIRRCVEDLLEP